MHLVLMSNNKILYLYFITNYSYRCMLSFG